jgi:hypothetical protein
VYGRPAPAAAPPPPCQLQRTHRGTHNGERQSQWGQAQIPEGLPQPLRQPVEAGAQLGKAGVVEGTQAGSQVRG